MKRYIVHAFSFIMIAALAGLSSCGKDDPAPPPAQVTFERSTRTFGEKDGVVQINVILDRVAAEDVTVDYNVEGTATEGTDYTITDSGKARIKKGQASATIEIKIKDDTGVEGDETLILKITRTSSTGVDVSADNTMTVTITDDDAKTPVVSFPATTVSVSEGAGTVPVDIVLDKEASANMVVTYSVSGTATKVTDYGIDGTTGQLQIKAGQKKGTISIQVTDDGLHEDNETIKLSIDNVSISDVLIGDDDEFTLTIQDNDALIKPSIPTAVWNVRESDRMIEIPVQLNAPQTTDVTIRYTLDGSALDSVTAVTAGASYDYAIRTSVAHAEATPGRLVIKAGQTTGLIRIALFSDYFLEDGDPSTTDWDPETIVISIKADAGYTLGADTQTTVRVDQEDGRAMVLFWNETDDVDMDLVLWRIDPDTQERQAVAVSQTPSTEGVELVFIPAYYNASFGASYVYYSGDVSPLDFEVHFIDFVNYVFGARDVFAGQYDSDNINTYPGGLADLEIEQYFDIVKGTYTNFTPIDRPVQGSRVRGLKTSVPAHFRRGASVQPIPLAVRRK